MREDIMHFLAMRRVVRPSKQLIEEMMRKFKLSAPEAGHYVNEHIRALLVLERS